MRLNEQFRILCCLAPDWVFNAREDCSRGGGLLPRLFTLAARAAVCFLLHCPYARLAARAPPFRTESRSVVSGLSSRGRAAGECPPKILKELPFSVSADSEFPKAPPDLRRNDRVAAADCKRNRARGENFVRTVKSGFSGLGRTAPRFSRSSAQISRRLKTEKTGRRSRPEKKIRAR